MRFWVIDEDGKLFRKFWERADAERYLQDGWHIEVQPKQKKRLPTVETHGEARW